MKVLLSAYACEPGKGSDPGIGWNRAVHLARRGDTVWVITRENNRLAIERVLRERPELQNLHFAYYDLPKVLRGWKKGYQGIHLYYFLWQIGAFFEAQRLHRQEQFDAVQHVTFVTVRQPSFMGLLGIPFVFGPVGGGETSPKLLREGFPLRGYLWEAARDLTNALVRWDPLMHLTFSTAEKILVASPETRQVVPARYHHKTVITPLIGWDASALPKESRLPKAPSQTYRLLYAGRLWYWKGVHLALEAFAQVLQRVPEARFTIIGKGPEETWLKTRAKSLGVLDAIDWIPMLPREALFEQYPQFDVFLFPSLHDSGGFVVLEAMAFGLPVVCLDIGGPGLMVDPTSGKAVETAGRTKAQVVKDLAETLILLRESPETLQNLRKGAEERVHSFTW